jgi:hypothetical protein
VKSLLVFDFHNKQLLFAHSSLRQKVKSEGWEDMMLVGLKLQHIRDGIPEYSGVVKTVLLNLHFPSTSIKFPCTLQYLDVVRAKRERSGLGGWD